VLTEQPVVRELERPRGETDTVVLPRDRHRVWRFPSRHRDALAVFALALGLRLVFSALMANAFDKNEFVYLALGRDVAHGAIPYRDFAFFHPPGILVVLAFLDPLTRLWWPLARLVDVLIDSATATLVWRVGVHLYGRRLALVAGVLYAVNPVVLVSAVRVDQEALITALGMTGLTLLLTKRSHTAAAAAGACLGAACWIKYPALAFFPVYVVAAPRRLPAWLLGFLSATALLFFPYLGDVHRLYDDTIAWQLFHRRSTPLSMRLKTTAIFWVIANPLAVVALLRVRKPLWLVLGFATGCVFILTRSAYSPYFVPIAPFAALLGAPLAARLIRMPRRVTVLGSLAIAIAWAVGIRVLGSERGYVIASRFSDIRPVIQLIDRSTSPGTPVLANHLEYAYLAGRPWIAHYFWDDHDMLSAQYLQRRLRRRSMVVLYPFSDRPSYPKGFIPYLDAHYAHLELHDAAVWLMADRLVAAAG